MCEERSVHPHPNMVMPAIAPAFPVRMLIAIARPYRFPVAVFGDVAVAVPAPVAAGPDVARTRSRFFFDNAHGRRLRGNDFNLFGAGRGSVDHSALVHHSFFHAAGRERQRANQRYVS